MNNQLAHIFDHSVCLTKRQLRDYVSGQMGSEEAYALELHLNSCPLCSEAVEGLQMHPEETVAMLHEMNSDFLQEHFALHTPHVHLNSMAPAASMPVAHSRKKNKVQPFWRNASIAAAILLGFGLMWYLQFGREKPSAIVQQQVAQNKPAGTAEQAQPTAVTASDAPAADAFKSEPSAAPASPVKNTKNGGSPQKPQLLISSADYDTDKGELRKTEAKEKTLSADQHAVAATGSSMADEAPGGAAAERAESRKSVAFKKPVIAAAPAPVMARSQASDEATADKKTSLSKAEEPADETHAALKQYNKDISNPDESRRHAAMLGAANSYAKLGQKEKAIALLQKIINEGGAEKHKAKVLLRRLNKSR